MGAVRLDCHLELVVVVASADSAFDCWRSTVAH